MWKILYDEDSRGGMASKERRKLSRSLRLPWKLRILAGSINCLNYVIMYHLYILNVLFHNMNQMH